MGVHSTPQAPRPSRCDFKRLANTITQRRVLRTDGCRLFQICGSVITNDRPPKVVLSLGMSSTLSFADRVPGRRQPDQQQSLRVYVLVSRCTFFFVLQCESKNDQRCYSFIISLNAPLDSVKKN